MQHGKNYVAAGEKWSTKYLNVSPGHRANLCQQMILVSSLPGQSYNCKSMPLGIASDS